MYIYKYIYILPTRRSLRLLQAGPRRYVRLGVNIYIYAYIYICIYVYMYVYILYMCVCVCVIRIYTYMCTYISG